VRRDQVVEGFGGSTVLGLERRVWFQSGFQWAIGEGACDGTQDAVVYDYKQGGCFAFVVGQRVDISVVRPFDQAVGSSCSGGSAVAESLRRS